MRASAAQVGYFGAELTFPGRVRVRRPAKDLRYIRYGQPALHQATVFDTEVHQRYPYDLRYRVSSDYATLAQMLADGAKAHRFEDFVALFDVSEDSFSLRMHRLSRQEMAQAQRDILGLGRAEVAVYFARRWLMQLGRRMIEKATRLRAR